MKRLLMRTVLLASAFVLMTGLEAQAAKVEVAVKVDSTFFSRKLQRIAILNVITPSVEDERVGQVEDMIRVALQDRIDPILLVFPNELKSAAEHGGVRADSETLLRVWDQRRTIEGPAMEKVGPATSIDAVVAAEVTHFEQYQIDYTQEGYSTTTVGLKIHMYDARDNTLLWEASEVYVAKSPPYNPSNYVADAGGAVRQGIKGVPAPPEYDVVSQKVVDDIVKTFPRADDQKKPDKKKSKDRK